jgi:hypothetical protein
MENEQQVLQVLSGIKADTAEMLKIMNKKPTISDKIWDVIYKGGAIVTIGGAYTFFQFFRSILGG